MTEQVDVGRLIENDRIMNRELDYGFHKSVDDDTFMDLINNSKFRFLEGFISHLKSLTYLPDDNSTYSEMARLRGIVMIMECYVDERSPEETQLLASFHEIGLNRIRDARKGFKQLTLKERRFRVETVQPQEKEKRKFLGLIPY